MTKKRITIIHWDDDKDARTDVKVIINRFFGEAKVEYVFFDCPIDEFENKLIKEKMHFDLLIQDLLDKKNNIVGSQILKQLPQESEVIVLTRSADQRVENELKTDLIKVKPIKFYKADIMKDQDSFLSVIEDKTGLTRIKNIYWELEWDKNDPITDYQISIITKEHLENLILEYLNNKKWKDKPKKNVRITPLVSGQSGALVFQVEFSFEQKGSIHILLKVDKIESNIEKELESANGSNYQQIDQIFRIEYDNDVFKSKIKNICWYALTADFMQEGKTLKRRILEAKDYHEIDILLIALFKKCLGNTYLKNWRAVQNSTIIYPLENLMSILTKKKKAFILYAVRELSVLSDKIIESKVKEIFNFQNEKKALSSEETKEYNKMVLVHGDMHGNNIMVSRDGQIKIIDPANMGYDYWTRDLCMLIVDLFAYGIDYKDKQYFGIRRIKDWLNMGNRLFEGTAINNGKKNKVVCKVLSNLTNQEYIKSNLGLEPWFEPWEFQFSLVIEFLRISYKSNQLPSGKRAACLLIAFDGFEKAKKSYNTFVKGK